MKKIYALFPLFIFLIVFIGSGLYYHDFYKLPSPIAAMAGVLFAFIFFKPAYSVKIQYFLKGCGDQKIITMCFIYLLSGAFTTITKAIGAIDFAVNLGLHIFSGEFIFIGVFVISCILSFAIGTSVGTIVTLAPIVYGISLHSPSSLPLLAGCLLGGAMFGDNLSLISDTTIAATQSMQVPMKAKFIANFKIAFCAAIVSIVVLYSVQPAFSLQQIPDIPTDYLLLVPYMLVVLLAILGLDVFKVLCVSILSGIVIGLYTSSFSFIEGMRMLYEGFVSMNEIFILSLITGGLAYMVEREGGISFIVSAVRKWIYRKNLAYLAIAVIVGLVNFAVANNTVAILISGPIALQISKQYQLYKTKATAVLDIFSCLVQGIIPYGAQMLLLLQLTHQKVAYQAILQNSYYLLFLFLFTLITLFLRPGIKLKRAV